jgi:hypothetical protein
MGLHLHGVLGEAVVVEMNTPILTAHCDEVVVLTNKSGVELELRLQVPRECVEHCPTLEVPYVEFL